MAAARIMMAFLMALTVLNSLVAARAANNGHAFDSTAAPSFLQSRRRHHYNNNNPSLFYVPTSKLFTSASAETSTPSSPVAVNTLLSLRAGGGNNDSNSNSNNNIQTITSLSQFQSILSTACQNENNKNQLVVLDFTSNNCPPCRMIAPIYEDLSLSEEFEERVIFCKVNVSDHPEVAEYYGVDGWPTFLLFKCTSRGDDDDGDHGGHGGKEVEVVDSIVGGQAAKAGLYGMVAKHA